MNQNIEISKIKANPDFMMRDKLDTKMVADYKERLTTILKSAPIMVYEVDGDYLLTDGFHRLAAARQLNMDTIPAIVHKGTFREAYAAACLANLQHGKPLTRPERKKAIRDYIKLKVKLSNVAIAAAVGVSEITIRRYRRELEAEGEIEPQEKREKQDGKSYTLARPISTNVEIDEPEPLPPDPYRVWFDEHVICGDALEILPTFERKFDLIIADPPYGITDEKWDLKNKHELLAFTRRWLNQALLILKSTGRLYVFWSREYMFDLKPLFDEIKSSYPLEFGGVIVWNFRNVQSQPDSRRRYKLGWEPLFYYYGLDAPTLNFPPTEITGEKWKGEVQSDVWIFAIPQSNFKKDKRVHPTQKPMELYKRIIETGTHTNDSVLDFFAGSGTTGHAALETGRDFTLIESNPNYVNTIYDRLKSVWERIEKEGK